MDIELFFFYFSKKSEITQIIETNIDIEIK